jgi:hypothetical protein
MRSVNRWRWRQISDRPNALLWNDKFEVRAAA